LNAEYAYVVRPGGLVYTITDVEELSQWMIKHFDGDEAGDARELWERVGQEEIDADPCVRVMSQETEEAKKVTRNNGGKYIAVFRRRENPEWV
jgi:tRNA (guanine-N7-)-methyltransferase